MITTRYISKSFDLQVYSISRMTDALNELAAKKPRIGDVLAKPRTAEKRTLK